MNRDHELELYKKIDDLTEALKHNKEAEAVYTQLSAEIADLYRLNDALRKENQNYMFALLKIYSPEKYHHWEEDPYTRAACFQFIAQEALKAAT